MQSTRTGAWHPSALSRSRPSAGPALAEAVPPEDLRFPDTEGSGEVPTFCLGSRPCTSGMTLVKLFGLCASFSSPLKWGQERHPPHGFMRAR